MILSIRILGRELLVLTWTRPHSETLFAGEANDFEYTTADLEARR